jgi:hypothetical protein
VDQAGQRDREINAIMMISPIRPAAAPVSSSRCHGQGRHPGQNRSHRRQLSDRAKADHLDHPITEYGHGCPGTAGHVRLKLKLEVRDADQLRTASRNF